MKAKIQNNSRRNKIFDINFDNMHKFSLILQTYSEIDTINIDGFILDLLLRDHNGVFNSIKYITITSNCDLNQKNKLLQTFPNLKQVNVDTRCIRSFVKFSPQEHQELQRRLAWKRNNINMNNFLTKHVIFVVPPI